METFNLPIMLLLLVLRTTHGALINVALHKPTKFSDENLIGELPRVVDGNPSFLWTDHSCIMSQTTTNNWWVVDLLWAYDIYDIRISNRRYLSENLVNFHVYISMENPLPIQKHTVQGHLCFTVSHTFPRSITSFQCNEKIRGRFVYLWKPADDTLQLCEFEVLVEEETKRKLQLSLMYGNGSTQFPAYRHSIMNPYPTPSKCTIACLDQPQRPLSHIQIDKKSGECRCIQYSPLLEDPLNVEANEDYDLYEMTLKVIE